MKTLKKQRIKSSRFLPPWMQPQRNRKIRPRPSAFELETMEPRILLSATPLYLATGDILGFAEAKVQSQLESTFNKAFNLGESLNTTLAADTALDHNAPLVGQSLRDIFGNDTNLGDFLKAGSASSGISSAINSYFTGSGSGQAAGLNSATSSGLAAYLDAQLKNLFSEAVVTDNSDNTTKMLRLDFNLTKSTTSTPTLDLGTVANELNLVTAPDAHLDLTATRTVKFSLLADLSQMDVNYLNILNPVQGLGDGRFSLDFDPTNSNGLSLSATINHTSSSYISDFGLGVGIIEGATGAGGTGEGAYAHNSTAQWNLTAKVDFTGSNQSFTLAELKNYNSTNTWTSAYDVTLPVGNTVTGSVKSNQANMILNYNIRNTAGQTDFIGGLGSVAGVLTFSDLDLTDNRAPVLAADATSQYFARIDTKDMLDMIAKTAAWGGDLGASDLYNVNMPFVNQTLGGAYDFGKAFDLALTKQLSFQQNLLGAINAPTSAGASASDFSGKTSFYISIGGGAFTQINLGYNASRDTLDKLVTALNNQLTSNATVNGLVQVRKTGRTDFNGLEFYSTGLGREFAINGVNLSADIGSETRVLDLGLPSVNQLTLLAGNNVTAPTGLASELKYQLPGAWIASGINIDPTNFATAFSFQIAVNDGTTTTTKTIVIPGAVFTSLEGVAAVIQTGLIQQGVYDAASQNGVTVKVITNPATTTTTESQYLVFYALNGVESFTLSDVTSGGLASKLLITPGTATNPLLYMSVNGGAAQKVILNGNFMNGLAGAGATSMVDLTRYLNQALVKAGLGNETLGTGIGVQALKNPADPTKDLDKLFFFARNPGTSTGQISTFSVTSASTATLLTQLGLPTTTSVAAPATVSQASQQPTFRSVQDLARRIATAPIHLQPIDTVTLLPVAPFFDNSNSGASAKMFSFPIAFTVGATQGLTDKNDVALALNDTYGDLNGLTVLPSATDTNVSTADIARSVTAKFTLEFKLQPSSTTVEEAVVSLPLNSLSWDGKLTQPAQIKIGLADGNLYTFNFSVTSTASNTSYADFATQLQTAINGNSALNGKITVEAYSDPDTGIDLINFRSSVSPVIRVEVPEDIAGANTIANLAVSFFGFSSAGPLTGTGSPSAVVGTSAFNDGFTTPTTAMFINFTLPDGSSTTLIISDDEFAGITTTSDLLDAINLAIAKMPPLMYDLGTPRVEAYLQTTGSGSQLAFRLNSTVYPSGTLTVSVPPTYTEPQPNGLDALDIHWVGSYFGESNSVGTELLASSKVIASPYVLSQAAVFAVTVGGSSYGTVTVPVKSTPTVAGHTVRNIADLIADINNAIANTNVTFQTVSGPVSYSLDNFVRVSLFGQTDQLALRLRQDIPSALPQATYWRLATDASIVGNGAIADLGFSDKEQMFQPRGGERSLNNITIDGFATATGTDNVDVDGNLGFLAFASTDGSVTSHVDSRAVFSKGTNQNRFTLDEIVRLTLLNEFAGVTSLNPLAGSTASLTLKNVAFKNDVASSLAITGLNQLPSNASIKIDYGTLTSVTTLPTATFTYTNFKGLEKLAKLTFQDVFDSLARSGEVVSDYMRNAGTPYGQDYLFLPKKSLSDLFDLGDVFSNAVFQAFTSPATNLQQVRQTLITSMNLDATDLALGFALTFDTGGNLTDAKLNVNLDFLADLSAFSFTLPMFIDLAKLRSRTTASGLVNQDLVGISTLTPVGSSASNNFDLHLTGSAALNLRAGVNLVQSGSVLVPTPTLYNTTTINELVNLAGEGLSGDLPVANVRLHVDGGSIAVNKEGLAQGFDQFGTPTVYNTDPLLADTPVTVAKTVRVATTRPLVASYVALSGTSGVGDSLRADALGSINALNLQGITNFAAGDLILVNSQVDQAQNGIYQITELGDSTKAFVLSRVNLSGATTPTLAGELDALNKTRVTVTTGSYANQVFRLDANPTTIGTSAIRFARLIDPAEYTTTFVQNQVLPRAVTVATTAALNAVYAPGTLGVGATLTSSSNQWINGITVGGIAGIDGFTQLQVGDLVLVKNQPTDDGSGNDLRYQNGVYEVMVLGQDGTTVSSAKWVLKRVAWADSADELGSLRISVLTGNTYTNTRFIQTGTATGNSISAGQNFLFSTDFNLIYNGWANTTAVGQAVAVLPISIITTTGGYHDNATNTFIPVKETTYNTFPPLIITIPNALNSSGVVTGNGLDLWHDSLNHPFPVQFNSLPDWRPAIGATNPLNLLRDPLAVGDYLDLALFNLQLAIDQTVGNQFPIVGAAMADYTVFVEAFRSQLTNAIRTAINADKLRPMTQMRAAIFDVLGPTGLGYLTQLSDVDFKVLDSSGVDTGWNFGLGTADPDNATTPVPYDPNLHGYILQNGKVSEIVKSTATTIELKFTLSKPFDTDATAVTIPDIDLFAPGLGMVVGRNTNLGTGGVQFKRSFNLNFAVGFDLTDGFYMKAQSRDATGALIAGAQPDMYIKTEAVLDGNVNAVGVQDFAQANLGDTTWNNFQAKVVDAKTTPGGKPSGFYGEFVYNYQQGSGSKGNRLVISDLRDRLPVGDSNLAGGHNGIFDYTVNADADLHLIVQASNSVVQGIEADLIMSSRYGAGAPQLSFPALPTTLSAKGNVLASSLGLATTADDYELPTWRYDRAQIANGHALIALMNVTVDAESYRQNSVIKSLSYYWTAYQPIKPIVDFFASPIPGISSILPAPLIPIDIIGKQFGYKGLVMAAAFKIFQAFGQGVEDTLVNQSVSPVVSATWKPSWERPKVNVASISNVGLVVDDPSGRWNKNEKLLSSLGTSIQNGAIEGYNYVRDWYANRNNPKPKPDDFSIFSDSDSDAAKAFRQSFEEEKSYAGRIGAALSSAAGTVVSAIKAAPNYAADAVKSGIKKNNDAVLEKKKEEMKKYGKLSPVIGISGGGFRYDLFWPTNLTKLLLGQDANIFFVEVPRLEIGVAWTKYIPLPPFPALGINLGASFSIYASFNMGVDSRGFYFSTVNNAGVPTPVFGAQVRISAGASLTIAIFEAGVELFVQLNVDFAWNTDYGSTKLYQSQIDFLKTYPTKATADGKMGNLFDVTISLTIGLTFYVDIDTPFFSARILSKTFSKTWSWPILAPDPGAQLGYYDAATKILYLNMGYQDPTHNSTGRIFGDIQPLNENFVLTSVGGSASGENIRISTTLAGFAINQTYNNVLLVKGWAGRGTSVIDASSLQYAVVNFYGGNGINILSAGAGVANATSIAYGEAGSGGRNYLYGGTGSSTLTGGSGAAMIVGGRLNSVMRGGNATDTLVSGFGSDIIYGSNAGATFVFKDNFRRDRLYVHGLNNTVDLSAVTTSTNFNLGKIVTSASTGTNFVFLTPTDTDRINRWIGTNAGDNVTITYFPPNSDGSPAPLTFQGGRGVNFYTVYLGDPNARLNPNTTINKSRIRVTDANPNQLSRMIVRATTAETLGSFSNTLVENGRETLVLSGLTRVSLDAGDSVVPLGRPGVEWTDLGNDISISAGTFIMLGNVEGKNLTLTAKNSFQVTQHINIRDNGYLNIVLSNPDPLGFANLLLGPASATSTLQTPEITISAKSQIFDRVGTPVITGYSHEPVINTLNFGFFSISYIAYWHDVPIFDTGTILPPPPRGNGTGTLNLQIAGSIINTSTTTSSQGKLMVHNGRLIFDLRDSFGVAGNPIRIDVNQINGQSTSATNGGVYLYSLEDLNIRQAIARTDLNGISTASGKIDIELAAGKKLIVGFLNAGGGADIRLAADDIDITPNYTVWTTGLVLQTMTIDLKPWYGTSLATYYWPPNGTFTYNYYVIGEVAVSTLGTVQGSSVTGKTSDLYIENVTDKKGIEVGGATATTTGTLFLSNADLSAIKAGFGTVFIGRKDNFIDPLTLLMTTNPITGKVTIHDYTFFDSVTFRGSEIKALSDGTALRAKNVLAMLTYKDPARGDVLNGDIVIDADITSNLEALLASTVQLVAAGDLTLNRAVTNLNLLGNTVPNGAILLTAGTDPISKTGSIIVNGGLNGIALTTSATGGAIAFTAGETSGDITLTKVNAAAEDLIYVRALGGAFSVNATSSVGGKRFNSITKKGLNFNTSFDELELVQVTENTATPQGITLVNDKALLVDDVSTANGDISLTTTSGDMLVDQVSAGGTGRKATLDSAGTLLSVQAPTALFNVRGDLLDFSAAGEINLIVDGLTLDALTTAAGDITLTALSRGLTLNDVQTFDGAIDINAVQTGQSLYAKNVVSQTSSAANTITLDTGTVNDGDITVGIVNAGANADVFLSAAGKVLDFSAASLLTGKKLDVQALGSGTPQQPFIIDLHTSVENLVAGTSSGTGSFRFNETDDINLESVETFSGDITVNAGGGITYNSVRTPNRRIILDSGADITSNGAATDILFGTFLDARGDGAVQLNSTVNDLIAKSRVSGDVTITNSTGVTLRDVTTENGDIYITTGEVSQAGLILSVGNALFGTITAGSTGGNDIFITNYGSAEMAPATPNPTTPPTLGDGVLNALITGRHLDLTGLNTVTLKTDLATIDIDTINPGIVTVNDIGSVQVKRIVTNEGSVNVTAQNDLDLIDIQANGATNTIDLTAVTGGITQGSGRLVSDNFIANAVTGIQVITDIINATAHVSGVHPSTNQGDIFINELDDIRLVELTTFDGTTQIDAGDTIQNATTHTTPVIDSKGLILNSVHGVGLPALGTLVVNADWIEARATTDGGIYIHNLKGAELRHILANDGPIEILTDGNLLALDVQTFVDAVGNTISLTNSLGDMLIDLVQAGANAGINNSTTPTPPLNADVTFTSAGSINGVDPHTSHAHIMARGITFEAQTGIGNVVVPKVIGRVLGARTTVGDLMLGNSSTTDFTISGLYTGNGNIGFTQDGGGNLFANNIISGQGNILLSQTGSGGLFGNNIRTGGGNITVNSTGGGPLNLNNVFSGGGLISFLAAGGGNLNANNVFNYNGTINANTTGGGSLFANQFTVGLGNINLITSGGGNLYANNIMTGGGNLFYNAQSGASLFLGSSFSLGNTTLIADGMDFTGGPGSIRGSGALFLSTNDPTVPIYLFSPLDHSPFAGRALHLSAQDLLAFRNSFGHVLIFGTLAFGDYQVIDAEIYFDLFQYESENGQTGFASGSGETEDQGGGAHGPAYYQLSQSNPNQFQSTQSGWDESAFEDEGQWSFPDDVPAQPPVAAVHDDFNNWQVTSPAPAAPVTTPHWSQRMAVPVALMVLPVLATGRTLRRTGQALGRIARMFLY